MTFKAALVFVFLVLLLLPRGGNAQTVLTEDFETPDIPNYFTYTPGPPMVTATNSWTITQNSVDLYDAAARPEAAAFDGSQAVDLTGSPGEGVMETTFPTLPGTEYEMVFHYARNAYIDPDTARAMVEIEGTVLNYQGGFSHSLPQPNGNYLEYVAHFTADTTQSVLRFTSLTPGVAGITVDGISIAATSTVGIPPGESGGGGIRMLRAHPNPFTRAVRMDYETAEPGPVEVGIYDVRGRLVDVLLRKELPSGPHSTTWTGTGRNGGPVPSGVYFFVLRSSGEAYSRRIILIR